MFTTANYVPPKASDAEMARFETICGTWKDQHLIYENGMVPIPLSLKYTKDNATGKWTRTSEGIFPNFQINNAYPLLRVEPGEVGAEEMAVVAKRAVDNNKCPCTFRNDGKPVHKRLY
ncbi:hypothetical protein UA08_02137 [Talaromyces atroroseus]|uniref:Uncharacterized protein n=1 Tax=Talaromyces atroroseus TaxID=1441469 RepID=A0A225B9D0_TALAT|nr:hypothetical protein UA08_02137 [Talaromyces atroroseus]OKL62567.1 hypothetical protein UA08_02137 [Talaromyces atroroseus]